MKGRFEIKYENQMSEAFCNVHLSEFRTDKIDDIVLHCQQEIFLHDEDLIVYDHDENIFIDIQDLIEAWEEGERPEDLSMF